MLKSRLEPLILGNYQGRASNMRTTCEQVELSSKHSANNWRAMVEQVERQDLLSSFGQ